MNALTLALTVISGLLFAWVGLSAAYLYLLAFGSLRVRRNPLGDKPERRFAIAIPAHNEEEVIGATIATLQKVDYPKSLYDIFVVADFCADLTARTAREGGATCYERAEGMRGSKGAALGWLFERILASPGNYDAIVVFDADTQVDPAFLRVMSGRLARGDSIVQGRHCISNPQDGSFAALRWAMYTIDHRFQNLGREGLGLSCPLMGDSFCVRTDLLRRHGWSSTSLTEDYGLRLELLLKGIRISYEPAAIGCGEAPATWAVGRTQRSRWLKGTADVRRRFTWSLLREGLRRRDKALLDAAAHALLPSYSTTVLLAAITLVAGVCLGALIPRPVPFLWAAIVALLTIYPFLGLALERASGRAYRAILFGPIFILWRTWLALVVRLGRKSVVWVRTRRRPNP
jgi:cellulose synthase/poly-beta-1,6-N-acetylglucosamine synthase-like glycosyltransferase